MENLRIAIDAVDSSEGARMIANGRTSGGLTPRGVLIAFLEMSLSKREVSIPELVRTIAFVYDQEILDEIGLPSFSIDESQVSR